MPPRKERKESRESASWFISIGAGRHQEPLLAAARKHGHRILCVENRTEAPGLHLCDLTLQGGLLSPRRLARRIAESILSGAIAGVGVRSYGRAVYAAGVIAEELGVPGPDPADVKLLFNKLRYKEWLRDQGFALPRIFRLRNIAERAEFLNYDEALIARPASSHAKRGIRLLDTQRDRIELLGSIGRDRGDVLIEKRSSGREVTLLGFVRDQTYIPMIASDKIVADRDGGDYTELCHIYPSREPESTLQEIHRTLHQMVRNLALHNGPLVCEFLLPDDGSAPLLVEMAPELGGEYLAESIAPAAWGRDYFRNLLSIYTGTGIEVAPSPQKAVVIGFLRPHPGRIQRLELPDFEAMISHSTLPGAKLLFAHKLKEVGDLLSGRNSNGERPVVVALSADLDSAAELPELLHELLNRVEYEVKVETNDER